jgi:hypothetical protein
VDIFLPVERDVRRRMGAGYSPQRVCANKQLIGFKFNRYGCVALNKEILLKLMSAMENWIFGPPKTKNDGNFLTSCSPVNATDNDRAVVVNGTRGMCRQRIRRAGDAHGPG